MQRVNGVNANIYKDITVESQGNRLVNKYLGLSKERNSVGGVTFSVKSRESKRRERDNSMADSIERNSQPRKPVNFTYNPKITIKKIDGSLRKNVYNRRVEGLRDQSFSLYSETKEKKLNTSELNIKYYNERLKNATSDFLYSKQKQEKRKKYSLARDIETKGIRAKHLSLSQTNHIFNTQEGDSQIMTKKQRTAKTDAYSNGKTIGQDNDGVEVSPVQNNGFKKKIPVIEYSIGDIINIPHKQRQEQTEMDESQSRDDSLLKNILTDKRLFRDHEKEKAPVLELKDYKLLFKPKVVVEKRDQGDQIENKKEMIHRIVQTEGKEVNDFSTQTNYKEKQPKAEIDYSTLMSKFLLAVETERLIFMNLQLYSRLMEHN